MAARRLDEFDNIDRAIIGHLQVDGRMAYAQLGPLVGLSQAAARQRVNRLISSGVMQVVAVTDPLRLGHNVQAMIAIEASGDVRTIAAALARLESVRYVVIVAGRYDIMCEVVCESNDEILALINDDVRSIGGVSRCEILTYLSLVKQSYSWGTGD